MDDSEEERTNNEFLAEEASRPRARVVVLHRENDTAAGAQVEFNSYGSPFHFDVELARQGCSVVYPAAPQTRSRGAGAPGGNTPVMELLPDAGFVDTPSRDVAGDLNPTSVTGGSSDVC